MGKDFMTLVLTMTSGIQACATKANEIFPEFKPQYHNYTQKASEMKFSVDIPTAS
jgi:hypothetical protein